jgi:GT2 family glycosyltransferase
MAERTTPPGVTVTLVLYNSQDHLADCLASLRPDIEAGDADVVAVDNASPDRSSEVLQQQLPAATVIRSETNLGFAGGCNLAWPHVDGRYWLLLNPDVVLESRVVARLEEWMDANEEVAIASPWLRDASSATPAYPGRAFPSILMTLLEVLRGHRLLPARLRARLMKGPYVRAAPGEPVPEPGWVPGTVMIARVDAVNRFGPLDEEFFLYGEDLEWCWRARRSGWKVGVCPILGGTHHASSSSRRTWSDVAVEERIAAGMLLACRRMRGRLFARGFAAAVAVSFATEACNPRRSAESRHRAATLRQAWKRAAASA